MPPDAADLLADTLVTTLDTMAFLSAVPVAGPQQPPADAVLVVMEFIDADADADGGGRVAVVASSRFVLLLAGNVLGVSVTDADARGRAEDCFKELLNVVVGALMPRLAPAQDADVALTLPHARPFAAVEWDAFCAGPARLLNAEGQTLAARIDPRPAAGRPAADAA